MYCELHKKYFDSKNGCDECKSLIRESPIHYSTPISRQCPKSSCISTNIVKCGFQIKRGGKVQRYVCKDCGHTFTESGAGKILYKPEVPNPKFMMDK